MVGREGKFGREGGSEGGKCVVGWEGKGEVGREGKLGRVLGREGKWGREGGRVVGREGG